MELLKPICLYVFAVQYIQQLQKLSLLVCFCKFKNISFMWDFPYWGNSVLGGTLPVIIPIKAMITIALAKRVIISHMSYIVLLIFCDPNIKAFSHSLSSCHERACRECLRTNPASLSSETKIFHL